MKTFLKLSVFAVATVLIAISCNKMFADDDANVEINSKEFGAGYVKQWFYSSFNKSPEYLAAGEKDKQLPDWKNAMITKIDNREVVEYPFIKGKHSYPIQGDAGLSESQRKRIAEASLARVAFFKQDDQSVMVREINYIPDWKYLESKHFDISGIRSGTGLKDFTGRMIVKKWDGTLVSSQVIENGKITKVARRIEKSQSAKSGGTAARSSTDGCTTTTQCLWQQDCVLKIYGDGMMVDDCGPWYLIECWDETVCNDGGDCGTYGGCPPQPEVCDPNLVSPEQQEFNDYKTLATTPASYNGPKSLSGPTPVVGVCKWEVARGAIAGWKIIANTEYEYYNNTYISFNTQYQEYTISKYRTVSSYFIGSNTFIKSTWTQTAVNDQVINNKTKYAYGQSRVIGTVQHVAKITPKLPFCGPLELDATNDIDKTMKFYPR